MSTVMKRCPRCGVDKEKATAFSSGSGWCKQCASDYQKEKYRNNADYRESRKAYHREFERKRRLDDEWREKSNAALREKRATDPEWREKALSTVKSHRRRFIGRNLVQQASQRARRDGRECSLSKNEMQYRWETHPFCAYCEKPLVVNSRAVNHDSPTLDRVRQDRGYTPENTVLACYRCNTLKRDATVEEIEALAINLRRLIDA